MPILFYCLDNGLFVLGIHPGYPVQMYGYPKAMETQDLLDASTPLCVHGAFSRYTPNGLVGIVEYQGEILIICTLFNMILVKSFPFLINEHKGLRVIYVKHRPRPRSCTQPPPRIHVLTMLQGLQTPLVAL